MNDLEVILDDILDLRDAVLETKVFTELGIKIKDEILNFIEDYL